MRNLERVNGLKKKQFAAPNDICPSSGKNQEFFKKFMQKNRTIQPEVVTDIEIKIEDMAKDISQEHVVPSKGTAIKKLKSKKSKSSSSSSSSSSDSA